MTFDGFPATGIAFLAELQVNNEREWFKARKDIYDDHLKVPGLGFVEAMQTPLKEKISPHLQAVPKVGGSLFRQHRDTRFSKDKRPYKDHFDFFFWEGSPVKSSWSTSGFLMRLQPPQLMLGCGIFKFDKDALARYRAAVDDDKSGPALVKVQQALAKKGFGIEGEHYKRVPKGFAKDHPREALLRHNGLTVFSEMSLPAELGSKRFVPYVMKHYVKMTPLHRWLMENVVQAA